MKVSGVLGGGTWNNSLNFKKLFTIKAVTNTTTNTKI